MSVLISGIIIEVFFQKGVKSFECIDDFLSRFSFNRQIFTVYFEVSKFILQFKDILKTRLKVIFDDDGNFSKLKHDNRNIIICFKNIEALDNYSAMKKAYNQLDLFLKFYKFIGNKNNIRIQKIGMVVDSQGKITRIPAIPLGYNVVEEMDDRIISKSAENTINMLIMNARSDFYTLLKAIDLHNTALSLYDYKNAFLNLWSILEVLCTNRVNQNSIIDEIINIVVPILKKDYLSAIFIDLNDNLKIALGSDKHTQLLKSVTQDGGEVEKIAFFVLLPEYSKLRSEYYSELKNYPVLRSRIWQMNEKSRDMKSINSLIEKYGERVTWHLQRMYRARNSIIHSGEAPTNIKLLGEHLHIYVDSFMYEIIGKLRCEDGPCSIDNVITDSKFVYRKFCDELKNNKQIDELMIRNLLYPSFF